MKITHVDHERRGSAAHEEITPAAPGVPPDDMPASPGGTLQGRRLAVLVTDGIDAGWVDDLRHSVEAAGAQLAVIAPTIDGVERAGGGHIDADHALADAPSVLFDAVVVAPAAKAVDALVADPDAVHWVQDAFRHLKVIGHLTVAAPLLERAGLSAIDEGVLAVDTPNDVLGFLDAAMKYRVWAREKP